MLQVTEQELQTQLEKRAQKNIRKQQATAEAAINRVAKQPNSEKATLEEAMIIHLAATARSATLAARATEEEPLQQEKQQPRKQGQGYTLPIRRHNGHHQRTHHKD
jgi:hypothetical protein